jgi:hypothetical protein
MSVSSTRVTDLSGVHDLVSMVNHTRPSRLPSPPSVVFEDACREQNRIPAMVDHGQKETHTTQVLPPPYKPKHSSYPTYFCPVELTVANSARVDLTMIDNRTCSGPIRLLL